MLRNGERLPVAAGQVLNVRHQVIAEHIEHLALKLVALEEGLVQQMPIAPNRRLELVACRNEFGLAAEVLPSVG